MVSPGFRSSQSGIDGGTIHDRNDLCARYRSDESAQMVQERLTQAHALPNVSSPPVMLQPVSSTSRVMNIGLSSKSVSLIDMSIQARWNIAPRLAERSPGSRMFRSGGGVSGGYRCLSMGGICWKKGRQAGAGDQDHLAKRFGRRH